MSLERATVLANKFSNNLEQYGLNQLVAVETKILEIMAISEGSSLRELQKIYNRAEKALENIGKGINQVEEAIALSNEVVALIEESVVVPDPTPDPTPDPDPDTPQPDPDSPDDPDTDPDDDGTGDDIGDPGVDLDESAFTDPVPLTVNGKVQTYATPVPPLILGQPHPRFFIPKDPDELNALREKYNSETYRKERTRSQNTPMGMAFKYALFGDEAAGISARNWLLNLPQEIDPNKISDGAWEACIVADWIWPLLDEVDRHLAMQRALMQSGIKMPTDGTTEFELIDGIPEPDKILEWKHGYTPVNDPHEPYSHSRGFLTRSMIPLTFYGDGIRDEWCQWGIDCITTEQVGPFYKIYHPDGGLVDGHNATTQIEGGMKAGHNQHGVMTGYNLFFFNSPLKLLLAWWSATGDDVVRYDNYYRTMPMVLLTGYQPDRHSSLIGGGDTYKLGSMLSCLTGVFKDDPDGMDKLNNWMSSQTRKNPYGTRNEELSIIFSDRRQSATPDQLGLPKGGVCSGDAYSRSGWTMDNDTVIRMTDRPVDTNRHPNDVGVLGIYVGDSELLPRGMHKKGRIHSIYGCDILIWKSGTTCSRGQGKGNYWNGANKINPYPQPADFDHIGREYRPRVLATHVGTRGPKATVINKFDNGIDVTVGYVDRAPLLTYYDAENDRDYGYDVDAAIRQFYHVRRQQKTNGREFVIVRDILRGIPQGFDYAWYCRSMDMPLVNGGQVTLLDGNHKLVITPIVDPSNGISRKILGGPGKVTELPTGETVDGHGYYFRDDPDSLPDNAAGHTHMYGMYGLSYKPLVLTPDYTFEMVMEILPADEEPSEINRTPLGYTFNEVVVTTGEILEFA